MSLYVGVLGTASGLALAQRASRELPGLERFIIRATLKGLLILMPLLLRGFLRNINKEALSQMTHAEAVQMHAQLSDLLPVLQRWVAPRQPWKEMLLFPWLLPMRRYVERLDDLHETLSWSADPAMRHLVEQSLAEVIGPCK